MISKILKSTCLGFFFSLFAVTLIMILCTNFDVYFSKYQVEKGIYLFTAIFTLLLILKKR